jgi:hypothetical protein
VNTTLTEIPHTHMPDAPCLPDAPCVSEALHVFDGVIKLADQSYMEDAKGSLVPLELVKPADKLMDETVRSIMAFARDLSAQIARFKGHIACLT